jgi:hypothetical protein
MAKGTFRSLPAADDPMLREGWTISMLPRVTREEVDRIEALETRDGVLQTQDGRFEVTPLLPPVGWNRWLIKDTQTGREQRAGNLVEVRVVISAVRALRRA